jgi:hypothetical protein
MGALRHPAGRPTAATRKLIVNQVNPQARSPSPREARCFDIIETDGDCSHFGCPPAEQVISL